MRELTLVFLKIFIRNKRAIFFVIFLPLGIFFLMAFLRLENVIQFDLGVSYPDFLLPGIMAYAIMQAGIYTAAYSVIDYKKLGVLKRLAVTPLSSPRFLAAHSAARFMVSLMQAGLLLAVGLMFFGANIGTQIVLLPVIILIGTVVFLNFGHVIAALARDYEEAAPYTTIVGLTLGFLGDVFFPVANLPTFLQKIAEVLPMGALAGAMRYSLFGIQSSEFMSNLLVLTVWFVLGTAAMGSLFAKKAYR